MATADTGFTHDADAPLVARLKNGDEGAFERLIERYQRPVYQFSYRYLRNEADAEEVAQEVFVRVFRHIRRFEPRAKFSTWLYTIARNLCLNALRSRRGYEISLDDDEDGRQRDLPSPWKDPLERRQSRELGEAIAEAVAALPVNLREAVVLCKYQGMKYTDAADILGCTEGAVKLRIHRAKALLAESLEDFLDE